MPVAPAELATGRSAAQPERKHSAETWWIYDPQVEKEQFSL